MDRLTYVVSGMRRTGTSMMMHCLSLGGMDIVYSEDQEVRLRQQYPNNPNEYFYELGLPKGDWGEIEFMRGRCFKAMGAMFLNRGLSPMNVVYMKRAPLSQYKSSKAACGILTTDYAVKSEKQLAALRSSDEIASLRVFDYDEVLSDPAGVFTQLRASGWPIDPKEASTGVDASRKHY